MLLRRTDVGSAPWGRREVYGDFSWELQCSEGFEGEVGNTGAPELLDPPLFAAVVVDDGGEGAGEGEEDEPVAGRELGADGGEA